MARSDLLHAEWGSALADQAARQHGDRVGSIHARLQLQYEFGIARHFLCLYLELRVSAYQTLSIWIEALRSARWRCIIV